MLDSFSTFCLSCKTIISLFWVAQSRSLGFPIVLHLMDLDIHPSSLPKLVLWILILSVCLLSVVVISLLTIVFVFGKGIHIRRSFLMGLS